MKITNWLLAGLLALSTTPYASAKQNTTDYKVRKTASYMRPLVVAAIDEQGNARLHDGTGKMLYHLYEVNPTTGLADHTQSKLVIIETSASGEASYKEI